MRFGSGKATTGVAAVLVVAALLGGLMPAGADELPPSRYSASVTPTACEATAPCSLTFSITNGSPPNSGWILDHATITAPSGFAIAAAGTPTTLSNKSWTASISGNQILLDATSDPLLGTIPNALTPGETVNAPVTVTASLSVLGPKNEFKTTATGSNPTFLITGPVTFTNTGSDPNVAVVNDEATCTGAENCQTSTVKLENTSGSAFAPANGQEARLRISVGGAYENALRRCKAPSYFTPKGRGVTTDVTGGRTHIVTIRLSKVINNSPGAPGAEKFQVCVAADSEFVTRDGTPAVQNEFGKYEGKLPDCTALFVGITKCVEFRGRNSGDAILKYRIDPGDPTGIAGLDQFLG